MANFLHLWGALLQPRDFTSCFFNFKPISFAFHNLISSLVASLAIANLAQISGVESPSILTIDPRYLKREAVYLVDFISAKEDLFFTTMNHDMSFGWVYMETKCVAIFLQFYCLLFQFCFWAYKQCGVISIADILYCSSTNNATWSFI